MRVALYGILFASLVFIFTGCGPKPEAAPKAFVFARGADAQKLDPADVDDGESVNTMAQVFEGLMAFRAGSLEVEPRLAESYSISADGLRYTFKLRSGVVFHDGTPLNADTARFTFDRQMDPDHPAHFPEASFQYWQNLFADIERVETVDDRTLRFHLSSPNVGLLATFAAFPSWLVSPGGFDKYGDKMAFHPVGTGPYRFIDWRPNEAVILERNPHYWREPAAGFERLVLRSIPLNTSRLSELVAGNIHGLDGIQPSELEDLAEDPRFEIHKGAGLNVGYLAFCELHERMRDPDLRKAISMAIDRENLVDLALNGYGSVAEYPAPEGMLGVPDDAGPIRYNPEAAKALVQANPQWLEKPIELATFGQPRMYFPDPQRIASLIRSDLEKIGLKVEIVNREFKSHLHISRRGEAEMVLLGWVGDTADPDNFLTTFFHSKSAVVGSALNVSFYRNPEMDALLEKGLTISDRSEREAVYGRILDLWARDLPLIPLVQGDQITVMDKRVRGYVLSPSGNHYFGPAFWKAEAADE